LYSHSLSLHDALPILRSRWCLCPAKDRRIVGVAMNVQRDFLLLVTLAAAVATPALGQTAAPAVAPVSSGAQSTPSVPDFSGVWRDRKSTRLNSSHEWI